MGERIGQGVENISDKPAGAKENVPAIESQKPAHVDPHSAEAEGGDDENPAPDPADPAADDGLHHLKRTHAQKTAGPGEEHEQPDIKPQRRRLDALKMNEVGHDVGGVG